MAKETAEQKLLRLIEQSGGGTENASGSTGGPSSSGLMGAQQTLNAVQSVTGAIVLPNFFQRVQFSFKAFSRPSFYKDFGIKEINAILTAGTAVIFIVFGFNIHNGLQQARRAVEFNQPIPALFSNENILPFPADIERYLLAVSSRNIFNPFEKKEILAQEADSPAVIAVNRIMDRTQPLRLVGLSWLETSDTASAMVENIESGVTYFLRSGEKLNGMTVESIYADSIVLEFEGERVELRL
jgi:hypothetical protein